MVLGRTHIKDVAAKRKIELNSYLQSLMNASTDVAECDLVCTFFHPLLRDEKAEGIARSAGELILISSWLIIDDFCDGVEVDVWIHVCGGKK